MKKGDRLKAFQKMIKEMAGPDGFIDGDPCSLYQEVGYKNRETAYTVLRRLLKQRFVERREEGLRLTSGAQSVSTTTATLPVPSPTAKQLSQKERIWFLIKEVSKNNLVSSPAKCFWKKAGCKNVNTAMASISSLIKNGRLKRMAPEIYQIILEDESKKVQIPSTKEEEKPRLATADRKLILWLNNAKLGGDGKDRLAEGNIPAEEDDRASFVEKMLAWNVFSHIANGEKGRIFKVSFEPLCYLMEYIEVVPDFQSRIAELEAKAKQTGGQLSELKKAEANLFQQENECGEKITSTTKQIKSLAKSRQKLEEKITAIRREREEKRSARCRLEAESGMDKIGEDLKALHGLAVLPPEALFRILQQKKK